MPCVKPHVTTILATTLTIIAFLTDLIGLVAPAWFFVRLGEKGDAKVGLWDYCYQEPRYYCEAVKNHFTVEAWLEASRGFAIMGFLTLCVCVASSVCIFVTRFRFCPIIAPFSALGATFCIFLEWAIFAGKVELLKNTQGQNFRYHYAFALTIVAFILLVPATVLHFVGSLKVPYVYLVHEDKEAGDHRSSVSGSREALAYTGDKIRSSRDRDLNRSRDSEHNRSRDFGRDREGDLNKSRDSNREERNRSRDFDKDVHNRSQDLDKRARDPDRSKDMERQKPQIKGLEPVFDEQQVQRSQEFQMEEQIRTRELNVRDIEKEDRRRRNKDLNRSRDSNRSRDRGRSRDDRSRESDASSFVENSFDKLQSNV